MARYPEANYDVYVDAQLEANLNALRNPANAVTRRMWRDVERRRIRRDYRERSWRDRALNFAYAPEITTLCPCEVCTQSTSARSFVRRMEADVQRRRDARAQWRAVKMADPLHNHHRECAIEQSDMATLKRDRERRRRLPRPRTAPGEAVTMQRRWARRRQDDVPLAVYDDDAACRRYFDGLDREQRYRQGAAWGYGDGDAYAYCAADDGHGWPASGNIVDEATMRRHDCW